MSDKKSNDVKNKIPQKIGIIAGSGILPKHIYNSCVEKSINCHILGIEKQITTSFFDDIEYKTFSLHAVSKILNYLKEHNIQHIIFAGRVKRTNISKLLFDSKGAKLFTMIMKNGIADNSILTTIIKFFEKEGLIVISPEEIISDMFAIKGNMTEEIDISKESYTDIWDGFKILKGISQFDVGQALIIQNGLVLGIEAAEGTNELIKRCKQIKQKNIKHKPILIKICKSNQDKRIDLPCIGSKTIELLYKYKFGGVALESSLSLILDKPKTIKKAKEHKIFIYGV